MASHAQRRLRSNNGKAPPSTFPESGARDHLFRVFVDAVADYAIYLIDPEEKITSWNKGAERLTGYTAEEVLGKSFTLLYSEQDRASGHAEEVRRIAERVGHHEDEGWRVRKDGSRFWAHVVLTAVRDEDGQLIGFAKVMHDLTRQRAAGEELRESEERYRLLADLIPQHIWTTDPDGYHSYFSRRWFDYTGAKLEDTAGTGWLQFLHPDDRARTLARWQYSLDTGEPYSIEYRFRRTSGEYCWFLGQALPQRDETGTIIRWVGTLTDISERKRLDEEREQLLRREQYARADAERKAREERALREAIAAVGTSSSTADALCQIAQSAIEATGSNGAFVTRVFSERDEVDVVARAGEVPSQFGSFSYEKSYTRQAIVGRAPLIIERLGDFHDPSWVTRLPRPYHDWSMLAVPLISGKESVGALFLLRDSDKPRFSSEEGARAQTFGELAAFVFRRLQLLEEAQRRRDEVERVSESRSRLMRGFSHDLKNPLGAADGYAGLLEEGIGGTLAPQQRDSIRRIRRSIKTSLRLINDLLEFARAEAGEIELKPAPVDVGELARETAEDFRAQLVAAGLELHVRVSDSIVVESDQARVRQILSNLLSNAAKYTQAGSVTVDTTLRRDSSPSRPGEWLAVCVADTGAGVPEDKREVIFQEFTRLDPQAQQGAGVGLAISRRIARLLGGDITVEDREPHGSIFTLWLPRLPLSTALSVSSALTSRTAESR